jgi:DnaA family protein
MQQLPLGVRIRDRAVFGTFLPARNAQAVDHLTLLAGRHRTETTWICGPHGTGKTHLLQAVCVQASETQAAYYPMGELSSLGVGVLEELPPLDCLCIDDVDAITGKREWERALFVVLRDMQERGARLVLSAEVPPALIPWSLPDLGSRCSASAVFQLRALDEEEQRDALKLRARVRGFELPDDTARWLQRRFPRDMHTLYELLDTLDEASLVAQRRLTVPFIRTVLKMEQESPQSPGG